MSGRVKRMAKSLAAGCGLLLLAGIIAPYLSTNRFGDRIRAALERALGRKVETGAAHLNLFTGPGLSIDRVVIHEDPSLGLEPFAYVGSLEAVPRLWPLFRGRLEFASIRLDDASINLAKTGLPSETGRWNFEPLLNRSLIAFFPEIHVRSGRVNFKFGDTKSVFYLTSTDLDISPPSRGGGDWSLRFSGEPARTDRPARGFGSLAARGHWTTTGAGRLDLDLQLERSAAGEIIALVQGQNAGIHGLISARMHLAGPLHDIRIAGRVKIEDVHRWDLLPPKGEGWPLNLQGRLNLLTQDLELVSSSPENEALPLTVRYRCSNYLWQPRWGVSVNWNRFPVGPLLELARHMGAPVPPRLKMTGSVDGVLGYAGQGSLQGELAFHDMAVTIPDSEPIRFEQARMLFDRGHVHLAPALARTADDQAQLEADYSWNTQAFELSLSTESMDVTSLRSQVALAAVPWLEQVGSGHWKGQLHYRRCGAGMAACGAEGWSGRIQLEDGEFPLPGLAEPLQLESASAQIQGPRVTLDHIRARAGKVPFEGEYHYEPQAARPHWLRIAIAELDAAELERLLAPTLGRAHGLIGRAFGLRKAPIPEWLASRQVEGTVQIGALALADTRVENVRAHLVWDVTRIELDHIQARLEGGAVSGNLAVSLRGVKPAYRLESRLRGINWKSGKLDATTVLETNGMGAELLSNLRSEGTFTGRSLEVGSLPPCKMVSGSYTLVWGQPAPRLSFPELQLSTGGELYTGRGSTQADGQLVIQLSSGNKEMRVSGPLAQLHVDEAVDQ